MQSNNVLLSQTDIENRRRQACHNGGIEIFLDEFDAAVLDFDDLLVGTQKLARNTESHNYLYLSAIEAIIGTKISKRLCNAVEKHIEQTNSSKFLKGLIEILNLYEPSCFKSYDSESLGVALEDGRRSKIFERAVHGEYPVLEGVHELLGALRKNNKKIAIYSSNRRSILLGLITIVFGVEPANFTDLGLILCGDDVAKMSGERKPAPFGYHELAKRLQCDPARIITFDDSCEGLEGGLAAGFCKVIGVDGGKGTDFSALKAFRSTGRAVFVNSLAQIQFT